MNCTLHACLVFVLTVGSVLCSENDTNIAGLINLYWCQRHCANLTAESDPDGFIEKMECPSSNCFECTNLSSNSADFPQITVNASSPIQMDQPKLLCRESNSLTFRWGEVTPAIGYVVEIRRNDTNWEAALSSGCSTVTLKHLAPSTYYKIRVRIVHEDMQILNPIESKWGSTLPSTDMPPLPIPEIWVDNFVDCVTSCNVILKWKPAEDLSCAYDFAKFEGKDYENIEVRKPQELFELQLRNVSFGSKVSVIGRAVNLASQVESDGTSFNFTSPTCLQIHGNLISCSPVMPHVKNVSETLMDISNYKPNEDNFYNVTITWDEPKLQPDYYWVIITCPHANNFNRSLKVQKDATEATITKLLLKTDYKVTMFAVSYGGESPRYISIHPLKPIVPVPNHPEPFTYVMFISILVFFLLAMTLLIVYLFVSHCRAKMYREKCRQEYFKELDEKSNKLTSDIVVNNDFEHTEFSDKYELKGEIILNVILGEGAFGVVRRGWLQRPGEERQEVAIKMLKDEPTIEEIRQIRQEIEIMKSVGQHPHLVSLLCCCTHIASDGPKTPLLVVEYCARGDLQSYLRAAWNNIINTGRVSHGIDENTGVVVNQLYEGEINIQEFHVQPKDLLSFGRQIVLGMEYLSKLRVVHRDLAARNVLVCEDGVTVKVADFGLSRDIYRDNVYYKKGNGKLPIKWMALESLTHRWYTTQSDVWSFGILMWEIVTLGGNPYPNINTKDFVARLEAGYRMEKPATCSDELYKIMRSCWAAVPSERPTFSSLKRTLEELLESETPYIHVDMSTYYKISTCRTNGTNSLSSDGSYEFIKRV